jgi:putative membrane protein
LHPLTPLLRGARMLALAVAAISWQGYAQLGFTHWLELVIAILVVMLAISAVSWYVTGYEIMSRELRVSEGLLWRRTRAIPLERLQAVDIVRPLLARLTGLAELRLEVVGAGKAEAPLAFLRLSEATALRERLLALAGGAPSTAAPTPAEPEAIAPTERLLHTVDNRRVLLGQLLTPHAWTVPIALLVTVVPYARERHWTFVAAGSLLTAFIGVVQVPVRRILDDWNFRIGADAAGLRLHHGLLDTRNQTVPPRRVQAIGITRPLLWRIPGWLHVRIDVAGYGQHDRQAGMRAGVLLPVAEPATARAVVHEVLGVDVDAVALYAAPARARWLAPLRQPYLCAGLTDEVVASTDGLLTRRLVVAPLARIQSVRVVQGPVQRLLRLADVHVDTAAGALHVVAPHRDVRDAYALADTLSVASRAARSRGVPHQRSTQPTTANVTPTYAQPTNTSMR